MGLLEVSTVGDTQPTWNFHDMGRIQVVIKHRFMLHHLVFKDAMEYLELTQGHGVGFLANYV